MANAALVLTNLADDGTLSASSEAEGMPVSLLTSSPHVTDDLWRSAEAPGWVALDLGADTSIDTIALLGLTGGDDMTVRLRIQSAAAGPIDPAPDFEIEFAAGVTPASLTFSRASTAYRVNASKLLESVATNVLRHQYNPSTGDYEGVLLEESRTNLLLRSAEFDNASWTKARASVSANTASAPDGTTTADTLIEDTTATNSHQATQNVTITAGAFVAQSIWAKRAAGDRYLQLQFYDGSSDGARAVFDLSGGTVSASGALNAGTFTAAGIEAYPDGWYRCYVAGKVGAASTTVTNAVLLSNAGTFGGAIYTGDGTSGLYLWGAQFEQGGTFPTSYIPTAGATAARSGDIATLTLGEWFNASEGALFADLVFPGIDDVSGGIDYYVRLDDGTSNNMLTFRLDANAPAGSKFLAHNGSTQAYINGQAISEYIRYRQAFAYKTDDFAFAHEGAIVVGTDSSGALPTGLNRLTLLSGGAYHIRRVAYFGRRLTNAELIDLTADGDIDAADVLDTGALASGSLNWDADYGSFVYLAAAPVSGRYVRIDLADPTAAYVEAGRLVVGLREALATNFAPGSQFDWVDPSVVRRSKGGQFLTWQRPGYRSANLTFGWVSDAQRRDLIERLGRVAGRHEDVLLVLDPDEAASLPYVTIWGLIADASPAAWTEIADLHSKQFRIEERR